MIKNKAIRLELGNTPMKNGMVLGVSIPYEKKKTITLNSCTNNYNYLRCDITCNFGKSLINNFKRI